MLSMPAGELIHLGMDTSKDTIVVGVLYPGQETPVVDRVFNDEESIRRLIARFADRRVVSACYEAGPGGFELYRLLTSMGVACEVVAPSLIPKGASDRVKTDKRDAFRLARLHRARQLTAIRVPTPAEEAVRDLVRARADALDDRKRIQQRLTALLVRHGRIWRGGSNWTGTHRAWIGQQSFDQPALNQALASYRGGLTAREAELAAVQAELATWAAAPPLADAVARLGAYRGIATLTALTLAAEVGDWRRFATARAFMGYCGLIPSEYSSGQRPPGSDHQNRPRHGPHRVDRSGLGLPAPPGHRSHPRPPPGQRRRADFGPLLDGPAAAVRQIPKDAPTRQAPHRGRGGRGPGAGRVRLGGDDQLNTTTRGRTRRPCPNRWCTATHAAAGTIPEDTLNHPMLVLKCGAPSCAQPTCELDTRI